MNVLVTGGAGFIGSHVCERLTARGDRVVVVDSLEKARAMLGYDARTPVEEGIRRFVEWLRAEQAAEAVGRCS